MAVATTDLGLQQETPAVWQRRGSSGGRQTAVLDAADWGSSGKRVATGGAADGGCSGKTHGRVSASSGEGGRA